MVILTPFSETLLVFQELIYVPSALACQQKTPAPSNVNGTVMVEVTGVHAPPAVGVMVGVNVRVGVLVISTGVGVLVRVCVRVGVLVKPVGVRVGVLVITVDVRVGVKVIVISTVGVLVLVLVMTGVLVLVGVLVVGPGVNVLVGVLVADCTPEISPYTMPSPLVPK